MREVGPDETDPADKTELVDENPTDGIDGHATDKTDPEPDINREHLVTFKDIKNIEALHGLSNPERLHSKDGPSVQLWVEEMKKKKMNPVLFFKPQGEILPDCDLSADESFLVIMTATQKMMLQKFGSKVISIDSTHGTNPYHFQLTTVLCIDEFGVGYPVAFCVSSTVDTSTMELFFRHIKSAVGEIRTKIIMTDDTNIYSNAWTNVMGAPEKKLLCAWHVLRNWKSNLCKIAGDKQLKDEVFKFLKLIIHEKDSSIFESLIEDFVKKLSADKRTQLFGAYFMKTYCGRKEIWAYCFREYGQLTTNNHIEAMHNTLKNVYMEGRIVRRLDKCVHLLLKLARDRWYSRITNKSKGARTSRVNAAHVRHKRSRNM